MTAATPGTPHNISWRFARATAPLTTALAGRRWFPGWAVVHHRGRTSGRDLTVPVAVIATPDVFVINLPWGAGTNWVRNVTTAGHCVVTWKGVDHPVADPVLLDEDAARPYYGSVAWAVTRRLFPADTWLLLHRAPAR
jgi:hypothetical protein